MFICHLIHKKHYVNPENCTHRKTHSTHKHTLKCPLTLQSWCVMSHTHSYLELQLCHISDNLSVLHNPSNTTSTGKLQGFFKANSHTIIVFVYLNIGKTATIFIRLLSFFFNVSLTKFLSIVSLTPFLP